MYYVIPQFRVNCIEKKIAKCNARRRIWTTVNYSITEFIDLSSKSFRYGVPFEYFWSTFWNRILFFVTSIIFRNVSSFVCDNFSFVRDIFSYARNVFRFVRNVSSFLFYGGISSVSWILNIMVMCYESFFSFFFL